MATSQLILMVKEHPCLGLSMMFLGEHDFQTPGGTSAKQFLLVSYCFSCSDVIQHKSAGDLLRIHCRTLVREFHYGTNRKVQTKYNKLGSGSEASEKRTTEGTCWLLPATCSPVCSCGWSCYALSMSGRRTDRGKKNATICLHWASNYVPAVACSQCAWHDGTARGTLPAVHVRVPLTGPCHAAGHDVLGGRVASRGLLSLLSWKLFSLQLGWGKTLRWQCFKTASQNNIP